MSQLHRTLRGLAAINGILLFAACTKTEGHADSPADSMLQTVQSAQNLPAATIVTKDSSSTNPPSRKGNLSEVLDTLAWNAELSNGHRRKLHATIETKWSRRGTMEDTMLVQPGVMIASDHGVILVDDAYTRIVSMTAEEGKFEWMFGTKGSGPKEWRGPISLAGYSNNDLVVFDRTLRRLSTVSQSGAFVGSVQVTGIQTPNSICMVDNIIAIANTLNSNASKLTKINVLDGTAADTHELPWPEFRDLPSIAAQVTAASTDGGCLIGSTYGSALAKISSTKHVFEPVASIEKSPTPITEWRETKFGKGMTLGKGTTNGASALARVGRYVVVAFGGQTTFKRRLLDFYDWSTGVYAGTLIATGDVEAMAGFGDMLFLRTEDESGFYRIDAIRIRVQ